MTAIQAEAKLFEYFSEKDTIDNNQIGKMCQVKGKTNEQDLAAFMAALKDLEVNGIIFKNDYNGTETWVLKKPLTLLQQSVILDGITSLNISQIVNNFAEISKNKEILCSPLAIGCNDINVLIQLISLYAAQTNDSPTLPENPDKNGKQD